MKQKTPLQTCTQSQHELSRLANIHKCGPAPIVCTRIKLASSNRPPESFLFFFFSRRVYSILFPTCKTTSVAPSHNVTPLAYHNNSYSVHFASCNSLECLLLKAE
ncbi:unnamed protein product [Ixodes persulcatus]